MAYGAAWFAAEQWVWPLVERWGYQSSLNEMLELVRSYGPWVLAVTGLTPLPFKLGTLACGLSGVGLIPVLLAALVSRVSRYLLVAWIATKSGQLPWGGRYFGWFVLGLFLCVMLLFL